MAARSALGMGWMGFYATDKESMLKELRSEFSREGCKSSVLYKHMRVIKE
jgi:hypothetical protein